MEGNRNINNTTLYPESGLGFTATRMLKTIKLSNENSPPIPGFHMANNSPASPIPHSTNVIKVKVSKPEPGLFRPSSKEPIKKSKVNPMINIPIMLDVQRMILINVVFFIFIQFKTLQ